MQRSTGRLRGAPSKPQSTHLSRMERLEDRLVLSHAPTTEVYSAIVATEAAPPAFEQYAPAVSGDSASRSIALPDMSAHGSMGGPGIGASGHFDEFTLMTGASASLPMRGEPTIGYLQIRIVIYVDPAYTTIDSS